MNKEPALVLAPDIAGVIHLIRDKRVILDSDLAGIYGVTTKRLNEQLRRNADRFPPDFAFKLTRGEREVLQSQVNSIRNLRT